MLTRRIFWGQVHSPIYFHVINRELSCDSHAISNASLSSSASMIWRTLVSAVPTTTTRTTVTNTIQGFDIWLSQRGPPPLKRPGRLP